MEADHIFDIATAVEFEAACLETFQFQYERNPVYNQFCKLLGVSPQNVLRLTHIPFLPIEFFKSKRVLAEGFEPLLRFESSGTTGSELSTHYIAQPELYEKSYLYGFKRFYGDPKNICILALLPSYSERKTSSLIYMVQDLIRKSEHPLSGFYHKQENKLIAVIQELEKTSTASLLIGVSFALLDLAENFPMKLKYTRVMETGGMKGRRKEMIREDLHQSLSEGFGVKDIHSEYGMTELLSQAYSKGQGVFSTPPWMKVLIRDTEDPMCYLPAGRSGGINVIDLANRYSCSFIATQDLGKKTDTGQFEVLGRFDHSDIRGCNLMVL